jgi:hypothetical protein
MPERHKIYRYTERLLHALGDPPLVMPTHWDRVNVVYDVSQQPAINVRAFNAQEWTLRSALVESGALQLDHRTRADPGRKE